MTGDKPMHFHPLMSRRTWLGAAALAAACTGTTAFAQAYPNKPIKIVVPFAAGGATDVPARVLVAHPSVTAYTGPELLKYVVANKGKVAYGSYGTGAYPHLAGAYMSLTQNADMSHVAYRGEAPMVQDLLGGQIQIAFASALQAKPHIEAGKLKAIGVSGERRMGTLPNVPSLAEQGLNDEAYRVAGWLAFGAPAGTPPAILERIADEVRKTTQLPDVAQRISAMGFDVH